MRVAIVRRMHPPEEISVTSSLRGGRGQRDWGEEERGRGREGGSERRAVSYTHLRAHETEADL
eukprot:626494-Rhodomonas_salina.2